ncbi:MAG: LysM peptidoglycan-binding domain-containing protein [Myxococcota bacterium]
MTFWKCVYMSGSLLLWASTVAAEPVAGNPLFPEPPGLESNVEFWTRIYTTVDGDSGLVHDLRDLSRVYEEVILPEGSSSRDRERLSQRRKEHYQQLLQSLARSRPSQPSPEEARILGLFQSDVSAATLRAAARRLRFQTGQSDKFRAGLIRSRAYQDHVQKTLKQMGLPPELAVLPHVESSYTPEAYSRAGAAGLWQFTRSTGRRFMRVDHVVDERLDPYTSTVAAARLLEQNYRVTGSWPLAITAYNHGASGVRRATRKLGTRDIGVIAHNYKSRSFGFASRNFYAEFLAALHVTEDPERFFGPIPVEEAIALDRAELPFYTTSSALARHLGVAVETLRAHNPALLGPVWSGQKRVPRGFVVKFPRAELSRPLAVALQTLPADDRFSRQTADSFHKVRRGETLSHIAAHYGFRISELQTLNNLRSRHHIRAGQRLRLPTSADHFAVATVAADGRYTIQRGDTLEKIAKRFSTSEARLVALNDIRNRDRIRAGQVLKIPSPNTVQLAVAKTAPANVLIPEAKAQLETPSPLNSEISQPPLDVGVLARTDDDERSTDRHLLADPSDYSVSEEGTIEVQVGETLGHYADWLDLRASRLRRLNGMPYGSSLVVHRHIRLDFSSVSRAEFERKRLEFHEDIQEAFFAEWEITGTETHRLKSGDSLWVLSHRKFQVPLWLLQQYNPDLDFGSASAGTNIRVPRLKRRSPTGNV